MLLEGSRISRVWESLAVGISAEGGAARAPWTCPRIGRVYRTLRPGGLLASAPPGTLTPFQVTAGDAALASALELEPSAQFDLAACGAVDHAADPANAARHRDVRRGQIEIRVVKRI
jgi:hypothetical protein